MSFADIIKTHHEKVQFNLAKYRREFVDFTICAGDKEIKVHKIVMATCSDYFRGMWAFGSPAEEHSVSIKELDPDAVEEIVNFCYTNELNINSDNILDVLSAASYLRIQAIQDICVLYLNKHIDPSNCLSISRIPDSYQVSELSRRAYTFCMKNLEAVINEQEFLNLDHQSLAQVLSDDNIESEESTIMHAVIKWCEYDKESREKYLFSLVKEVVRLVLMDSVTLIQFSTKDLIQNSRECSDLFAKVMHYLLLQTRPGHLVGYQEQLSREFNTRPRTGAKRIYALGGWQDERKALASAEVYHPEIDAWQPIPSMKEERCGAGATTLDGIIYAVGGHDGAGYLKTVERFDTERWRDVAELKYPRTSLAVATVNGHIYAIGGQHRCPVDHVEVYSPANDTWSLCTPIKRARFGAGVAVLDNFIYVIGGCGYDPMNDTFIILDSVERYDTINDSWDELQPMKYARKHLGCCTCAGKIYAIGGRENSDDVIAAAEVYDPDQDMWREIAPMKHKRAALGVVEMHGKVYAAGGQCGDLELDIVEQYTPESDTWTSSRSMRLKRRGFGMTVQRVNHRKLVADSNIDRVT